MDRSPPDPPLLIAALEYASWGWPVAPLHDVTVGCCSCAKDAACGSPGKHPRTERGLSDATTDAQVIRSWWRRWPTANIAVVCGPKAGVWMVGPDGEAGIAALAELYERHEGEAALPATAAARSQSGGRHYLFTWPAGVAAIPNRKNHRGTPIDVRACGDGPGYFVAPPSVGPKGPYSWEDHPAALPPTAAPPWLVEWAINTDPRPTPSRPATPSRREPGRGDVQARAVKYLDRVPAAIAHSGGHNAAFWAARVLVKGFGLSEDEALGLLMTDYNPRCQPQWSERELLHKVREAAAKPFSKPDGWLACSADPHRDCPVPNSVLNRHKAAGGTIPAAPPPAAPEPESWGEPVPLSEATAGPPAFPMEVLPRELASFCLAVADAVHVPVDYPATFLLGLATGLVGATAELRIDEGWRERAVLYCCVVAPKSSGKTPAFLAIARPIHKEQARRAHYGSTAPVFVDDTTVEALAPMLKKHPRGGLLAADELAGWAASFNQYKAGGKGSDRQFWLKNWAGVPISVARKNPESPHTYVPYPCVSVVGGVQPAVIEDLRGRDDGFAERILFSYPDPLPSAPYSWTPHAGRDEWQAIAGRLLNWEMAVGEYGPRPNPVGLTAEARQVFTEWTAEVAAQNNDPGRDPTLDGVRSKLRGGAGRLALVRHALQQASAGEKKPASELTGEDMASGVLLARYFLAHSARVYGLAAADPRTPLAQRVLDWARKSGQTAFTRRDVYRCLHRQTTRPEDLIDPLKLLVQLGWLRYADLPPRANGGRPATSYEVHPELLNERSGDKTPKSGDETPLRR